MEQESLFKYVEIESLIKTSPNGKSGERDGVSYEVSYEVSYGVSYEDLKDSCGEYCHVIANIMNVMLINHRLSCHWKEAIIRRIPKTNFNIEDQSTLRDILLLPVRSKVLSKAICNRIIPIILNKIDFWQRAFLNKRDRQEHVFSLKTAFDDFRHKSTKFASVFIDFADAFGSIN